MLYVKKTHITNVHGVRAKMARKPFRESPASRWQTFGVGGFRQHHSFMRQLRLARFDCS